MNNSLLQHEEIRAEEVLDRRRGWRPWARLDRLELPPGRLRSRRRHRDQWRQMGQVGGEELSMALGERAEARAPDLLLTVEDQHDVDARAKAQPVQQPEGR